MHQYINFNHIYYFLVIAQEGSVTKASKKLHVTQPTLSSQLSQLEETLGTKLFDTNKRRLKLNKNGETVLNYAAKIFHLKEEMLSSLHEKETEINQVNIGVLPSLAKEVVYDFISCVWKHNNTRVHVSNYSLPSLEKHLISGDLDIVITDCFLDTGNSNLLVCEKVASYPIVAVAGNRFTKLKKTFPKSLSHEPLLHFSKHSQFRKQVDDFFSSHSIEPHIIGEVDDVSVMGLTAEENDCIAILPPIAVRNALKEKKLIQLGKIPELRYEVWMVQRKNALFSQHISESLEDFRETLKE